MLENPLHDAKIVQHLYERDEEEDGAQLDCRYNQVNMASNKKTWSHRVNKKPVLVDGVLVEKEDCSGKSLIEEISSQGCDPVEYGESSASLKNE